MAVDWSALPGSALVEISNRLPSAFDYIRFRSVCTFWRSAAPKRPHLPLLACYGAFQSNNTQQSQQQVFFFSLNPDGSQLLPILKLPQTSNFHRLSHGSSRGWMILVDREPNLSLWNPITKARIQLPPLSSSRLEMYCGLLSSDPSSDPDCIVLSMYMAGSRQRMAFCRPGRCPNAWTTIQHPKSFSAEDAVFYNGRFYFVCRYDVYVWNVGMGQPAVQWIPAADPPFDNAPPLTEMYDLFLVESGGDLLLVKISYRFGPETDEDEDEDEDLEEDNEPYSVEVYKLDLREQKVKLLKLDSLGDRALFVGYRGQSISITASNCPGCLANCVYVPGEFTDTIRVCSLENGCNRFVHTSLRLCSGRMISMWFSPSLLSGRLEKVDSFESMDFEGEDC